MRKRNKNKMDLITDIKKRVNDVHSDISKFIDTNIISFTNRLYFNAAKLVGNIERLDYIMNYTFGAIAGTTATLVSQPFNRLKIEYQNDRSVTSKQFFNIRWLYTGVVRSMIGYSAEKMLVFGTYNSLRSHDVNPTLAGIASGVVAAISVTPAEQLTIDKQNGVRCFRISHLYSGFLPTVGRECIGFGIHFTMYEIFTRHFNKEREFQKTVLCGTGAVISGWSVIAPIDRIKTQIQSRNFNLSSYNIMHSYHGFKFALMRAIPFHVTCFVVMEELKKHYNNKKEELSLDKVISEFLLE